MPAYNVTGALTDPSGDLVDGTKYVVQNLGDVTVGFAVKTAAFTAPPDDALILGSVNHVNMPSHLEYTYASTDHLRIWSNDGETAKVVFHPLG